MGENRQIRIYITNSYSCIYSDSAKFFTSISLWTSFASTDTAPSTYCFNLSAVFPIPLPPDVATAATFLPVQSYSLQNVFTTFGAQPYHIAYIAYILKEKMASASMLHFLICNSLIINPFYPPICCSSTNHTSSS